MPPKGWRKDAQGNYPTTSYIKEQENITIQDLLFPRSVITNLAKEVNSDNKKKLIINKDAGLALQRSATVFVNHLLVFAREIAKNQDRKSCNVNDIYDALDQIGLSGFKSIINSKMIEYQNATEVRKQQKLQNLANKPTVPNGKDTEDEDADEEEEEEDDDDDDDDDDDNIDDNDVEGYKEMSKKPKTVELEINEE